MKYIQRIILLTVSMIFICANSFAQQTFYEGNATSINEAKGAFKTDSTNILPTVKRVYPYRDSAGCIAVVSGALWFHDGTAWVQVTGGGGSGTVTSITAGAGLSGGTITTSGTISMPNVGTSGTYGTANQFAVITTDAQGRISAVTTQTTVASVAVNSGSGITITTGGTSTDPTYTITNASPSSGGTVTSVGLSSTDITIGGTASPITTSGTYSLTLPSVNSNIGTFNNITINAKGLSTAGSNISYLTAATVNAGNGINVTSAGTSTAPTYTVALPATGTAGTYGSATQLPIITTDAYGRVTAVTTQTVVTAVSINSGSGIAVTTGGASTAPTYTITNTSPSSGGTVTSVGLGVSSDLLIAGATSPITTAGTYSLSVAGSVVKSVVLNTPNVIFSTPINFVTSSSTATGSLTLNTQTANTVFAGPTSGGAATPTMRTLVQADLPRYVPLVVSAASYTTSVTINADITDVFVVTAQAGSLLFNAPSGTPSQGQVLVIRIKDNGTARALTYNSIFRVGTGIGAPTQPTTTTISKNLYEEYIYNSTDTKWDLVGAADGY